MAVCFEKKFLFDPKGNFKNVEIEAINGDLGLENGHGSKRSLFGHDRDNVTRYEHDVDNVNDDDFYILNKNDLMIQARHVQLKNISQP